MSFYSEPGVFDRRNFRFTLGRREFAMTLLIMLLSSAAALAAKPELGEVAAALIFVLGITIAGALCGLAAGIIAALAAFLVYNFYLTEPVLTFRLATGRDVAPLVVFNLCAIVAGILAGRLQDRARAASSSNRQLASLLNASETLQSALRVADVGSSLSGPGLGAGIQLYRARDDELVPVGLEPPDMRWGEAALLCHREGVVSTVHQGLTAYQLAGSDGPIGVMVVDQAADLPEPAVASGLANLVALALERATLSEMIADSRALARTEELKTALLSSVSHDFRTPLTAISASASSLIDYRHQLDDDTSFRLLRGIVDECDRLNRYTANLLEMSRLEAGEAPRHLQTLSVSDMLSTVVQRVRIRAGRRQIQRVLNGTDLLVNADAALFELVLVNVIDNAILYSEDETLISIECEHEGTFCRITVADEGQGIPDDEQQRVFERFYRVARTEASPRGSGLGLAIAKGFVEALGGSIAAETPGIGERGTKIVIQLPIAEGVAPE